MACRLDPRTGFQMAGEWLKYQLTAPVDTGPMNCKLSEKKKKKKIWFGIEVKMDLVLYEVTLRAVLPAVLSLGIQPFLFPSVSCL